MTLANGALGAFAAAFIAFIITWLMAFFTRFLNTPVALYHEQKDRADTLQGLRQIASDASGAPSFDLSFEELVFEESKHKYQSYPHVPICRIVVENLERCPIDDCRIVIERFWPNAPINDGALLLPDERSTEAPATGYFHLAPTEKRYFKFLEVNEEFMSSTKGEKNWEIVVKSDQDGIGFAAINEHRELRIGQRYFATIAVHGKQAFSRRINLSIDVTSSTKITVAETRMSDERQEQNSPTEV